MAHPFHAEQPRVVLFDEGFDVLDARIGVERSFHFVEVVGCCPHERKHTIAPVSRDASDLELRVGNRLQGPA